MSKDNIEKNAIVLTDNEDFINDLIKSKDTWLQLSLLRNKNLTEEQEMTLCCNSEDVWIRSQAEFNIN